jgi:GT2 family glycosyltransferase
VPSFIDSLVAQQYPLEDIRLIIVEHGSDAETLALWERAREQYGARFRGFDIYRRKNRGFGAGHNFALSTSATPFVLVTNIDLEFAPDAISTVMATAWADDADVASWELRQKPYEHPKYYDPVTLETGWSSHACILFRREAFRRVGGYERRIFMYGEDVELSYRLRDRGYRIKYCPQATVWHFSYEQPHQVKPLQFSGSTLANSYIRLRYGAISDILRIPSMYGFLLFKAIGVPGGHRVVMKNVAKILLHTPYFLATRKRSKHPFSFFGWDYELRRDGAFYRYEKEKAPHRPLVSVIMRTYRSREFWLREAIASVVNQTYPNIELLVIEDGGETVKPLIDRVRQSYPSLHILYQGLPKKGRAVSGNVGLSLAQGDFLMFLDDDDLLFADHIEVLVDELCADPTISAAYALTWEVETKLTYEPAMPYEELVHRTPHVFRQLFSREVLKHHNYIPIQALLFKRKLYEKYGGFDESMEYLEDWNLWTRYSSQDEFKFVEKTTSYFRTPYDLDERAKRQQLLDSYYQIAIHKQNEFYQSLMVKNEEED